MLTYVRYLESLTRIKYCAGQALCVASGLIVRARARGRGEEEAEVTRCKSAALLKEE